MIVNTNSIKQHQVVIQIKIEIIKHVNANVKIIVCKKDYSWDPSLCTCENRRFLKSVDET